MRLGFKACFAVVAVPPVPANAFLSSVKATLVPMGLPLRPRSSTSIPKTLAMNCCSFLLNPQERTHSF